MSNTRTLLTPIPASFKNLAQFAGASNGQLQPIRLDLDTANSEIGICMPQPDSFIALMGWLYAKQLGHILTLNSSTITFDAGTKQTTAVTNQTHLTDLEMNSGNGMAKEINGWPALISEQGKGLSLKSSAEPISMILYVVEFKQFRF